MSNMFTSASRPFFQSVSIMHLEAIEIRQYEVFAKNLFLEYGKKLSDGVIQEVYEYSKGVTWYTQKILNTLFMQTGNEQTCQKEDVADALNYILKTQSYSYEEILFRLPEKQKQLLVALAKNGSTKGINSATFLKKFCLPSASMVQSALRGLLDKDFVTQEKGTYYVYDLFLAYWIQQVL